MQTSIGVTFKFDKKKLEEQFKGSVKAGLAAAAIDITAQAKQLAPVDMGQLKGSISYSIDGKTAGENAEKDYTPKAADLVEKSDSAFEVHIGSGVEHAAPQEYGTKYQSGKSFLRPAVEARRAEIAEKIGIELKKVF